MHRVLIPVSLCLLASPVLAVDSTSDASATKVVQFAAGRATVPLPGSLSVTTSADGLAAVFGARKDHELELTLLQVMPAGNDEIAAEFVEAQAKKKGLKVARFDDRAALMEAGGQEQRDGKTFQSAHWQIAVGRCLFTLTIVAPLPMSDELNDFLGAPLNQIVQELTCKVRP